MRNSSRPRYLPPAETITDNRRAIRRRALSIARAERAEAIAEVRYYRAGGR